MAFREYESEMLRALPVHNVIITTGGELLNERKIASG